MHGVYLQVLGVVFYVLEVMENILYCDGGREGRAACAISFGSDAMCAVSTGGCILRVGGCGGRAACIVGTECCSLCAGNALCVGGNE